MSQPVRDRNDLAAYLRMLATSLVLTTCLAACGKAQNTASAPAQPVQRSFASPEEAGAAALAAAQAQDQAALFAIFGPDAREIISSGDAVKDQENMRDFVAAYTQMHRWRTIKAGGEMLYIGADNYLFPIPLDKNPAGAWQFDTDAGKDEILARRIGKNELAAIVTMSMVGITNTARSNAQKAEKQTVQVALDTMASDKELPQGAVCPAPGAPGTTFDSATDDMSIFPTSANPLYPNYLRIAKTQQQKYWCDTTGLVHGVATP